MNIHNNRYVIFIAPLIWSITVMFYTHSMYNISLAILFIFHNCINLIVISHKTFLKYNNPRDIIVIPQNMSDAIPNASLS